MSGFATQAMSVSVIRGDHGQPSKLYFSNGLHELFCHKVGSRYYCPPPVVIDPFTLMLDTSVPREDWRTVRKNNHRNLYSAYFVAEDYERLLGMFISSPATIDCDLTIRISYKAKYHPHHKARVPFDEAMASYRDRINGHVEAGRYTLELRDGKLVVLKSNREL
jgi:hypothetical protein